MDGHADGTSQAAPVIIDLEALTGGGCRAGREIPVSESVGPRLDDWRSNRRPSTMRELPPPGVRTGSLLAMANIENLDTPSSLNITSSTFGRVTGTQTVDQAGPRTVQFSLRYSF